MQATYDIIRLATEMSILEALTEIRDLVGRQVGREDALARDAQSRYKAARDMIKEKIGYVQKLVEPGPA